MDRYFRCSRAAPLTRFTQTFYNDLLVPFTLAEIISCDRRQQVFDTRFRINAFTLFNGATALSFYDLFVSLPNSLRVWHHCRAKAHLFSSYVNYIIYNVWCNIWEQLCHDLIFLELKGWSNAIVQASLIIIVFDRIHEAITRATLNDKV